MRRSNCAVRGAPLAEQEIVNRPRGSSGMRGRRASWGNPLTAVVGGMSSVPSGGDTTSCYNIEGRAPDGNHLSKSAACSWVAVDFGPGPGSGIEFHDLDFMTVAE